ncbi:MAG: LLM class flavin-dependent oxidoreductase [Candidatus Dormibacteraceae bacterium]
MPLRIGLGLFTGQVPPGAARSFHEEYREIIDLCRLAEDSGFDSVWVSEHHGAADGYLPSLAVLLGAIAAVTRRVALGTGVVLAPFQHPLRFAEDCAVLDQLAGGRLIVGLALGWRDEEFRAFGIPVSERVARTVELLTLCRLAWSGQRFTFGGKLGNFDQVAVTPRPAGPIPIWLGGTVDAAISRAGRLADGFLATRPTLPRMEQAVRLFDGAARAGGRDPTSLDIALLQNAFVTADGRTPEHVIEGAWHQLGTYAVWGEGADTPGRPFRLPTLDRDAVAARLIEGSPDQVLERLAPWIRALGSRRLHVIFRLHYPGMTLDQAAPAVELFASRVIPELRRLAV